MTTRSRESAEAEARAALEAQLENLAAPNVLEGALASLAAALFPDAPGEHHQLTWGDQPDDAIGGVDAEARVRAAEAKFKTLVEQIPAVTFSAVLGEGKNEIYVSPHIEQMLGFTQQEWLEAPFLWFWQLHPDDRDLWNQEFARGCQTGGPFRADARFFARDGHVVWVHGEARLVKDELGRPLLLQGVAFDITEIKSAQALMVRDAALKAKREEELAIAQRVQTSLLPKAPRVNGLEIATAMVPADEVGGDYFDVLPFDGGAWIAIGDVSGHGLDAGLVMLMVQSAMAATTAARPDATPREVVITLNQVLYDNVRSRLSHDDHVTLSLLRYGRDGTVVHAGAHEEFIVWRRETRTLEMIPTPGTWVGAMCDVSAATVDSSFALADGDLLVLYTDGIVEAMDALGEQYDIERLRQTVLELAERPVEEIRDGIIARVRAFMDRQDDDLSVVVVRHASEVAQAPHAIRPSTLGGRAPLAVPQHSLLEGSTSAIEVPALCIRVTEPLRLAASARVDGALLGLRLAGTAEFPDQSALESLLAATDREMVALGTTRIELDLRALTFMNSSCFKVIVSWLARLASRPADAPWKLRLVSDPKIRWQRASVGALVTFGKTLIDLDDPPPT